MSPQLEELWLEYAVLSFEKQLHLADIVGGRPWEFSMQTGQITFKGKGFLQKSLNFNVQILGTESHGDNSWLWAWANEASGIPENLLQTANRLRFMGEVRSVPELQNANFDLEQADGHALASIASGVVQGGAYYRGPYEGGAVFLLIQDPAFPPSQPDLTRTVRVIPEALGALPLSNHRIALRSYLTQRQWDFEENGSEVIASHGKDSITLSFDELNRLAELKTTLTKS